MWKGKVCWVIYGSNLVDKCRKCDKLFNVCVDLWVF